MSKQIHNRFYRFLSFLLLAAFLLGSAAGCSARREPVSRTEFFFDTVITLTIYDGPSTDETFHRAFALCRRYEDLFSRTREGSDIWNIAHRGDRSSVSVDPETAGLITEALRLAELSDGAFDPTVLPLAELWTEARETKTVPSPETVAALLPAVDWKGVYLTRYDKVLPSGISQEQYRTEYEKTDAYAQGKIWLVTLEPHVKGLDLGAVAKGYIADRLKEQLLADGVKSALIDLGGNLLCVGEKPGGNAFVLGVQQPFAPAGETAFSLSVKDKSLVTSGTYERFFETDGIRYHHLIDPKTGYPYQNGLMFQHEPAGCAMDRLNSVTILSDSSLEGDGYSTMCFALGPADGLKLAEDTPGIEAAFLFESGKVLTTTGFPYKAK
ncbi:MAG: FAD:protein FMN transferase [Lachnospiraceae bacterium]|nr:FAD:protein FMN transferase [Lachnospiraceae bacterium]